LKKNSMDAIKELIRPKFVIKSRFVGEEDGGDLEVTNLDWSATNCPLDVVETRVRESWKFYGNPHSCGTATSKTATEIIERAKKTVREHVLQSYDYEIGFGGDGSSYWLDRIPDLFDKNKYSVVCLQRELHNSLVRPWVTRGWGVSSPPGESRNWFERRLRYVREVEGKTPIVLISLASHVTGGVLRAEWLEAASGDSVLVLDATCHITHTRKLPDVPFDFAVFSGHKLPGGPGSPGVVIHKPVHRFPDQPGTPNVMGIAKLDAALRLRTELLVKFSDTGKRLVRQLDEFLRSGCGEWMGGFVPHTWDPDYLYEKERHPIFSFSILWDKKHIHPDLVSDLLLHVHGLQIRVGGQCTDYTIPLTPSAPEEWRETTNMDPILRPSVCRISLYAYLLTDALVEKIEKSLRNIITHGFEMMSAYSIVGDQWAEHPYLKSYTAKSSEMEDGEEVTCGGCSSLNTIVKKMDKGGKGEKSKEKIVLEYDDITNSIMMFSASVIRDKYHNHPYRWFLHPIDKELINF
jgi:selenocysteine lyase/cysteine desulfurase